MNYKEKYEDMFDKLNTLLDDCKKKGHIIARIEDIEAIFPELKESKESKDEMIRKALVKLFETENFNGYTHLEYGIEIEDVLAWLEKQGKQVSTIRWYDASLIPQEMKELLVEWSSSDDTWHEVAFYHADTKTFWDCEREVKNVTRWCYVEDLFGKIEQKPMKTAIEAWKDMRLEVYQQASGNRHEPNCSDNSTKMFSLNDIDEIFEKIADTNIEQKQWKPSEEQMRVLNEVVNYAANHATMHWNDYIYNTMKALREQLKQL